MTETRSRLDQARAELEVTQSQLRVLSLQIQENDALRSLFLLPRRPNYRYIYGEAVSKKVMPTECRLFVKIASQTNFDSDLRGSPVVASAPPAWVAIGQVVDVHEDIAEIQLLSDPRSRIGVSLADAPAFGSALLMGAGMDRMELDYATHPHFLRDLTPHLILVTSRESQFPAGLAVAEIQPESGRQTSSTHLSPRPLISFDELKYVVILAPAAAGVEDRPIEGVDGGGG